MKKTIGFVGLGVMGRPVALNLCKAQVPLLVYDVNSDACAPLIEAGAQYATLKEIGTQCEIILLMVPNGQIVESILWGEDGLADHLQKGSLICDMSSISATQAVTFARRLEEQGHGHYMDSPVSGGETKAIRGELTIMAGCTEQQFHTMLPYYQIIGTSYTRMGEIGSGCVAKFCNQIMVTANIAAICEAAAFAEKFGLDLDLLFQVMKNGSAYSAMMESRTSKLIARDFVPGAAINIHLKDIRNIVNMAQKYEIDLPITNTIQKILEEHADGGNGQLDSSSLLLYFEKQFHCGS